MPKTQKGHHTHMFFPLNSLTYCHLCVNSSQSPEMFINLQLIDFSPMSKTLRGRVIPAFSDKFTDNLVDFTGKEDLNFGGNILPNILFIYTKNVPKKTFFQQKYMF